MWDLKLQPGRENRKLQSFKETCRLSIRFTNQLYLGLWDTRRAMGQQLKQNRKMISTDLVREYTRRCIWLGDTDEFLFKWSIAKITTNNNKVPKERYNGNTEKTLAIALNIERIKILWKLCRLSYQKYMRSRWSLWLTWHAVLLPAEFWVFINEPAIKLTAISYCFSPSRGPS